MPRKTTGAKSAEIDPVTNMWRSLMSQEAPVNTSQTKHISDEKLVEFLSNAYALRVDERWHLRGCDHRARSFDVLRKLRTNRLKGLRHEDR